MIRGLLMFFFSIGVANGQDSPLMAIYPGIAVLDTFTSWSDTARTTNSMNAQYGYTLFGNDKHLLIGGGTMSTSRPYIPYLYSQTTGRYEIPTSLPNEIRIGRFQSPKIASSTSTVAADAGASVQIYVTNQYVTAFWAVSNQMLTKKSPAFCVDNEFPCDSVGISHDSGTIMGGEPSASKIINDVEQNGYVGMRRCAPFQGCSDAFFIYREPLHTGATQERLLWGRDPGSNYGSSITFGHQRGAGQTSKSLAVVGAPGDTLQQNGPEYPDFDMGGNNGDYRYGGYFQVLAKLHDAYYRIVERLWAPDGNTPDAAGNKFGSIVRLTYDGSKLLVTAPGTKLNGETVGAFYIYNNVQQGVDGLDSFELFKGPYYGPATSLKFGWAAEISPDGTEVFIGDPSYNNGDGRAYRFTYDESSEEYALQSTYVDESVGFGGGVGSAIKFDSVQKKLYVGAPNGVEYTIYDQTFTNQGKVNIYNVLPPTPAPTTSPTPDPGNPTRRPTRSPTGRPTTATPTTSPTTSPTTTPACHTTADCAAWPDRICDKASMGCVRVPCEVHGDCFGRTLSGRLPFCEPKGRICVDTRNSTCTQLSTCTSAATKVITQTNAISKASVAVNEVDPVKRASATQQTMEAVRNASSTAVLTVSATESIAVPPIANVTTEELLEAIKLERCGAVAELCVVSASSRRMLDVGDIVITIQYDIDDAIYNELVANGTNFNDPSFVESIAAQLNVSSSDVTIVDNGGVVEIQVTVVDVSEEGTPIESEVLSDFQTISSQLTDITTQVATNLGIDTSSFSAPVVDLCGAGRSCTNRGTCDGSTGICTCSSPAYYGLNCELVTLAPTLSPTTSPTRFPTTSPTLRPTNFPTKPPTPPPTPHPTGQYPSEAIGSTGVTLNIKNFTALSLATTGLIDGVKDNSTRFTVTGVQRFAIPLSVFNVDPDEGFKKGAIEFTRGCPSLACKTTFITNRRRLQSSGDVTVEVEYTLSEEAFGYFLENGHDFSTDEFAQRLMAEFGLPGTFEVNTISNSITIRVDVVAESQGGLPIPPSELEKVTAVKTLMDTQADSVIALFGVQSDSLVYVDIDLCAERDCNGRGECNAGTGVCACENGWLGINCQTQCVCQNGGDCSTGKCKCLYPNFGVLCEQSNDECTTCT